MAKRLGVIRGTINRWERGKVATPKVAVLAIKQLLAEARARAGSKRQA